MLFKVVLGNQIRVFDCKETPSMKTIHMFVEKAFRLPKGYSIYYLDEDQDQITLQSDSDLSIYLAQNKKPKIFLQPALQDVFNKTVKIQIDEKEHQKEKLLDSLSQLEKSINLSQKIQKKEEVKEKVDNLEVEVEEKPKKQLIQHPAACDSCSQEPIKGDQYKCAACKDFDPCSQCKSKKSHQHPLIEIKQPFQAPLDFLIIPQQSPQEAVRKKLIADRVRNSMCGKKQKMNYETLIEREQVILSFLGSLLGEDEFAKHKEFSMICKAETYEDVFEDYLKWSEEPKKGFKKVVGWFKKGLTAVANLKPFQLASP